MKKTLTRLGVVAALVVGGTLGAQAQAQASVGYQIDDCGGSENHLTVSTWLNDARTQRTYHWHITASGWDSSANAYDVLHMSISGIQMPVPSTVNDEGYYTFNGSQGRTIKGVWNHYIYGAAWGTVDCSWYF